MTLLERQHNLIIYHALERFEEKYRDKTIASMGGDKKVNLKNCKKCYIMENPLYNVLYVNGKIIAFIDKLDENTLYNISDFYKENLSRYVESYIKKFADAYKPTYILKRFAEN